MIDPIVLQTAETFIETWNAKLKRTPVLLLDGTWPSVGVLDLLTYELRGNPKLNEAECDLLRGVTAYLAKIAHDCWTNFGAEVRVSAREKGIELHAALGSSGDFLVLLEEELRKCLSVPFSVPTSPFPVIADFSRPVSFDANILSLFGIGLMTGLPPFGEGQWLLETPDSFKENIESAVKVLARGCADYYSRVYPQELTGQVAELYLHGLIYPPSMMHGEFPACTAVKGLLAFCKEYGIGKNALGLLAHNLALSPDDLLSQVGLALYCALAGGGSPGDKLSPYVIAAAQTKGNFIGLLRPAMLLAQEMLGLRKDWILEEKLSEADFWQFAVESELGFLPWVKLPRKKIKDKSLAPLLLALSRFEYEQALTFLNSILEKHPGDIDLGIQRVELVMLQGDFEKAEHFLRLLYTEPGGENNSILLDQWAMCNLAQSQHDPKKVDEALGRLERAYAACPTQNSEISRVANNYATALILKVRYTEAINVLNASQKGSTHYVTALLNKAYAQRLLGQETAAEAILGQLTELAPLDRRVIANLA